MACHLEAPKESWTALMSFDAVLQGASMMGLVVAVVEHCLEDVAVSF